VSNAQKSAASRKPVSRERALQVAVEIADAEGIDALSMRKLARSLGIEAMSLYYHVKDKDDILDGMVELVYSEITLPFVGEDWKRAMRERADSTRSVLLRHPWAISMVDERTTQVTMRHLNAVVGGLRQAGFSVELAAHALSLLDSYVHGFALQEASLPLDASGDITAVTEDIMAGQDMATELPYLAEMATSLVLKPGYAYGNEFEFGIQLILDGLESAYLAELAG
jgi:AcrR family transcriptional regulator